MPKEYVAFDTGIGCAVAFVGIVVGIALTVLIMVLLAGIPWLQIPCTLAVFLAVLLPAFVVDEKAWARRHHPEGGSSSA